uniref:POU domain protein n=1 Tax=Callorhinchus milii TaxID=7868 RepID=A0A4W3K0Z7_CALMI|eukprot:gi/632984059/ref/XP_007908952.1/ PREDICTED: POU domain, class 6, transcription factor 1 isoform X1 [Callorhinchus milii]
MSGQGTRSSQEEMPSKAADDAGLQGNALCAAPATSEGKHGSSGNVEAPGVASDPAPENQGAGPIGQAEAITPVAAVPVAVTPANEVQTSQQPQAQLSAPNSTAAMPQILAAEGLAAVVMTSTGAVSLNQPLLIPLNMAGQVTGHQGLVLTIPTASLATVSGLTTPTTAGGILKLPLANIQAASAFQPAQVQHGLQPLTALPSLATPLVTAKQSELQPQVTSIQPIQGLALNPTILSSQTPLMGSLAATSVIASALPGLQGITNQIITNAQGQVIGTLPFVLNPAVTPVTLSAQSLQVQSLSPQVLLTSQGQVIATVISNPFMSVLGSSPGVPASSAKTAQQVQTPQTAAPVTQPSVTPAATTATLTPSAAVVMPVAAPTPGEPLSPPINTPSTASVGQLVSKPQNAPTEVDGINLEEIREFAKNFKIRRLSLGLTQTQVGQALSAAEGPAYSQSAICRFEKLDITPKSAQKIKPVLERWLTEAEVRHRAGIQNLTEFVGSEPSKKRKRRTSFTPQALETLNVHFEKNTHPTGQEMTQIAEQLNYEREVVRVWFCNKRQTLKNTVKRLQQNDSGLLAPLTDSTGTG